MQLYDCVKKENSGLKDQKGHRVTFNIATFSSVSPKVLISTTKFYSHPKLPSMLHKMRTKFKNSTNTEDKKRLVSNFFSLSVLQGTNYILPLFTLPYLVRVLGAEYFGLLSFASATVAYFGIITDYGFNLTATREISIHRANHEKVKEIFSSVMTIKVALLLLSFFLLSVLVFSFEKFSKDWVIYLLTFGTIIGQFLFPVWFFQGMERMKYIAYFNILAKSIFTVAIFIFIQEQNDYYLVPILTSLGFIVTGIWSLWLVKKEFNVEFKWQSSHILKNHLIQGWHMFLTSIQSNILSSSGVFVLGLFQNNETVGYYSAVEKVAKAFVGLFSPATQALFPLVSAKLSLSKKQGKNFLIKAGLIILLFAFLISIIMIIFSGKIVILVLGVKFVEYDFILKILSIWLFFGVLNNFIGIQYLTGIGCSRYYLKSSFLSGLIAMVLFLFLTPLISIYGILAGMVAAEIALTVIMVYSIKRNSL